MGLEEMPYWEISAALVIPMGTVMSRLHCSRKALRGRLQQQQNQDDLKTVTHGLRVLEDKT